MTLTGTELSEMGNDLWGPTWPIILGARLRKTGAILKGWMQNGVPPHEIAGVQAAVEDQLSLVARYHEKMMERLRQSNQGCGE